MKKVILSLVAIIGLVGCGESGNSSVQTIERNATIPYDINTTISSVSNVSSITFSEGSIYVACNEGATCDITLGSKDTTTDNSVVTTTTDDHSVVDNGVVDNHSGVTDAAN